MKDRLEVRISRPRTPEQFDAYFELRWRVLRAPWRQPRGSERDEHEPSAEHLMAHDGHGKLVGVGRLHLAGPDDARVRYMAVAEGSRGRGVGGDVLRQLEQLAAERGARRVLLNARADSSGFYEAHGYVATGPGPTLFGEIRHVVMEKLLASKT